MEKGDGMSFAEFSYPLLQAWDWWHLYQSENIQIQIGGSDQFGNIVTGIDAIRHMMKISATEDIRRGTHEEAALYEPFGLTTPLLTTSSGAKFGKSAGNAVWLEKSMTSVFDLYGVSQLHVPCPCPYCFLTLHSSLLVLQTMMLRGY